MYALGVLKFDVGLMYASKLRFFIFTDVTSSCTLKYKLVVTLSYCNRSDQF